METLVAENQNYAEPFERFAEWLKEAEQQELNDPNAMALATVSADGQPSVRMVLLKGMDERGFVFYTNHTSRKAQEILSTGKASLLFHWKSLRRQVRVEGHMAPVSDAEADAYYSTRGRMSRVGAWASKQSQVLPNRQELVDRVAQINTKYPGDDIPRPPFWSGFRIVPHAMEFWYDGEARLHHRDVYKLATSTEKKWDTQVLYP